MDISATLEPKSDQLNAEDLLAGPRTVTVEKVSAGSAEQPVNIHLVEFPGRPFKPSKTVRRLIVAAWGPEATNYVGRRLTLYRDATVKFGGMDVGGIRVSHLSHLDKQLKVALTVTRGKRAFFIVDPLQDGPPQITGQVVSEFEQRIAAASTADELKAIGVDLKAWDLGAHKAGLQAAWSDRNKALKSTPAAPSPPAQESASAPESAPAVGDQTPVSDDQLLDLEQLRQAEKYDDELSWLSFVGGVVGRKVAKVSDLTAAEAEQVIAVFNEASGGAK